MPQKGRVQTEEKMRIVEAYLTGRIGNAEAREILQLPEKSAQAVYLDAHGGFHASLCQVKNYFLVLV